MIFSQLGHIQALFKEKIVFLAVYVYLRSGWAISVYHIGILNAMIHVVMYSYYFLSTFSTMKPYLWWKRYLTVLQLIQFAIAGIYMVLFAIWNCGFPPIVVQYNVSQAVILFALFSQFYVQRYTKAIDLVAGNRPGASG